MNKIIYILFISIGTTLTYAQSPKFTEHKIGESYDKIHFTQLLEHSNGLLYLSSNQGLFSFDGFHISPIHLPDSIDKTKITTLQEDAGQNIWIGTRNGEILSLSSNNTLINRKESYLIKSGITKIEQNNWGGLWIATYGQGIFYSNLDTLVHFSLEDGLLGMDINDIALCSNNKIWAATDRGISICNIVNEVKVVKNITKNEGLPDEIISTIIGSEKKGFWAGTFNKGFFHFNPQRWEVDFSLPNWQNGAISTLTLYENKELWIGTKQDGLLKFSFEQQDLSVFNKHAFCSGNKIYDVHKDAEGILWVLGNKSLCSSNRFFDYLETPLSTIQTTLISSQNDFWIGTQKGLFLKKEINGDTEYQKHLLGYELNIVSLYEDRFKNLWIGTFDKGLFIYNPVSKTVRNFQEKDGLSNNSVLSITGNGQQYWLATLGGISEINSSGNVILEPSLMVKQYDHHSNIGSNFIYEVFIDSQKRVWFCTDGNGISNLINEQVNTFPPSGTDTIKTVYSIAEDGNGNIWISTDQKRIFYYDGDTFHHYDDWKSLRAKEIADLATDNKGNIIIIHEAGLDLIRSTDRRLIYLNDKFGSEKFEANLNASFSDHFGNTWIAAQNHIIKLNGLEENLQLYPKTKLQNIEIDKISINFNQINSFKHNENNLTFKFATKWFSQPESVKYKYKLEGLETDWNYTFDQQASYLKLSPGNYEFKVNAGIHGDFRDDEEISYSFTISKPFWGELWFILGSIILIIFLIYSIIKFREKQLNREALLKKEKIESQFEALKAQINPHFLFNCFNTLVAIIEDNQTLAVEYVEKLSDYYRNIIQYRERDIIELQEELTLVKNYSFLLKERFGENFSLDFQIKNDASFVAPLTIQMLVENAVKHNIISENEPLQINIRQNDEYIYVSNNFQPKKIKEESTGFGLQNIHNRYTLLIDKKIKVEQSEQEFKVGIPIIRVETF